MNLSRLMANKMRVLFVGPPGCGKTARIVASASEAKMTALVWRASLKERPDVGGCLVPDMKAGITRALPLEELAYLQAKDCPPSLLFLDDLGQAPIDVQAACMRLFDPGFLSPNVLIWGATNRPGDKAGVTALCEPLRSRFHLAFAIATPSSEDKPDGAVMLGTWSEENDHWCQWAMDNNADPCIIAWHRSTEGRTLHMWKPHADPGVRMADYRSWETVINLRKAGIRGLHETAAAVGKPTAAEYCSFEALADKLPTPDQVIMDPKGAKIPDDPSSQYLIVSMLAAASKVQHISPIVIYLRRLPRVFSALLGRDLFHKHGAQLGGNKEWIPWFQENQKLFQQ